MGVLLSQWFALRYSGRLTGLVRHGVGVAGEWLEELQYAHRVDGLLETKRLICLCLEHKRIGVPKSKIPLRHQNPCNSNARVDPPNRSCKTAPPDLADDSARPPSAGSNGDG